MNESLQQNSMSLEMFKVLVPSIITIIGFLINILITKNSIKEEVVKKKTDIALEKLSDVPFEILELLDNILAKKAIDYTLQSFKKLTSKIFSYGSEDAIKIVSAMQQHNYISLGKNINDYKVMCYYILLCCQIKYDLTGIEICPGYWFKLKINDYKKKYKDINDANNEIVSELNLKNFLIIKNLN